MRVSHFTESMPLRAWDQSADRRAMVRWERLTVHPIHQEGIRASARSSDRERA